MAPTLAPRRLLTIAGSDSSGGAGIQADLKTFAAHGLYGLSAVTAVTAQNTREVRAVSAVPPEVVAAQIDAVLDDFGADAVKIGMLWNAATVRVVAARLRARYGSQDSPASPGSPGSRRVPIVLDPVLAAESGAALLAPDGDAGEAILALLDELLPLATLVTPNLPELARLVQALRPAAQGPASQEPAARPAGEAARPAGEADRPAGEAARPAGEADRPAGEAARSFGQADRPAGEADWPAGEAARLAMARQLAALGPAVLAKGGHDRGTADEVVDLLLIPAAGPEGAERVVRFAAPRLAARATHGTGCTLSAAIAARLAAGEDLATAVGGAIEYVRLAMAAAPPLGGGPGPLAHFHAFLPGTAS